MTTSLSSNPSASQILEAAIAESGISSTDLVAGSALLGGMLAIGLVIGLIWYLLQVIAYWRIFTKAGVPGWKSLIPIYNGYIEYKLIWNTKMFWLAFGLMLLGSVLSAFFPSGALYIVASLVAFIGFIINHILAAHKLSKSFGHGIVFTAGLIFLDPLFMLILGFGKSTYLGNTTKV